MKLIGYLLFFSSTAAFAQPQRHGPCVQNLIDEGVIPATFRSLIPPEREPVTLTNKLSLEERANELLFDFSFEGEASGVVSVTINGKLVFCSEQAFPSLAASQTIPLPMVLEQGSHELKVQLDPLDHRKAGMKIRQVAVRYNPSIATPQADLSTLSSPMIAKQVAGPPSNGPCQKTLQDLGLQMFFAFMARTPSEERKSHYQVRMACRGECLSKESKAIGIVSGNKILFNQGLKGLWTNDGSADIQLTAHGRLSTSLGFVGKSATPKSGDRFVFTAYSSQNREQLWSTDGTSAGTRLLRDTIPRVTSESVFHVDGKVFFYAGQLWVTDGTAEGTREIGEFKGFQKNFIRAGLGKYIFTTDSMVYVTDGTKVGTHALGASPRSLFHFFKPQEGSHLHPLIETSRSPKGGSETHVWIADTNARTLRKAFKVEDGYRVIGREGDGLCLAQGDQMKNPKLQPLR
jgi:ELWxxDGT repeat protein